MKLTYTGPIGTGKCCMIIDHDVLSLYTTSIHTAYSWSKHCVFKSLFYRISATAISLSLCTPKTIACVWINVITSSVSLWLLVQVGYNFHGKEDKGTYNMHFPICNVMSHSNISFAQWQYHSRWGSSEAWLLLIENYTQYPEESTWNIVGFLNVCRPRPGA